MIAGINGAGQQQFEREFVARPEYLSEIRQWVQALAASASLRPGQIEDLLTAVDEAASNAIRHGVPRDGGRIQISYTAGAAGVGVMVKDHGRGFAVPQAPTMPSPEATGGRGLPLMCALADSVDITSGPNGTIVRLFKCSDPAM